MAAAVTLATAPLWSRAAFAASDAAADGFTLPKLPYAPDALSAAIDSQTMQLHHGKHHQAAVDTLNKAVAADAALKGKSLAELVAAAGTLAPAVRNNAGSHWNHSFFWEIMGPASESGSPSEALGKAITDSFGSLDGFKEKFQQTGAGRFGSGWVWLVVGADGKLAVTSTPNQDNPLMDVAEVKGTPILGNDVWEHAYYLRYQNRRPEYLSAWWQVVNWKAVSERFAAASAR